MNLHRILQHDQKHVSEVNEIDSEDKVFQNHIVETNLDKEQFVDNSEENDNVLIEHIAPESQTDRDDGNINAINFDSNSEILI